MAVQAIGSFVSSNNRNGVRQETTNSGGILGTYRFFFSTHHGVEGNYGYARNTTRYSGVSNALGVRTNNHEVSGAYVFRYPMHRWQPFALAGAAALIFDPAARARSTHRPAAHSSMAAAQISTCRGPSSYGRSIEASCTRRRPMTSLAFPN